MLMHFLTYRMGRKYQELLERSGKHRTYLLLERLYESWQSPWLSSEKRR